MLMGATDNAFGASGRAVSTISTSGFLPSTLAASMLGPGHLPHPGLTFQSNALEVEIQPL